MPEAGDIVVTARQRQERLIDVPVAASVLTAEALARAGATQSSDIAKQIPQLEMNPLGFGSGANISLRGVGSSATVDSGTDQPVNTVIDGVGSSRGRTLFLGLFDVQSIETLKGPQALFFGKNSPAGVISVTTISPGDRFEGYAKASYNFKDRTRYVEGAVSVPLTDTLAVRVAGRGLRSRGYIENLYQAEPETRYIAVGATMPSGLTRPGSRYAPNEREALGRMTLRWTPSSDFNATLKVTGDQRKTAGGAALLTIVQCAPGTTVPTYTLGFVYRDTNGTCGVDYKTSQAALPFADMSPLAGDGDTFDKVKTFIYNLNMNYQAGALALTSITGYTDTKYHNVGNFNYTGVAALMGALRDDQTTFTQELRLVSSFDGPLNLTGGLLYEHIDRVFQQSVFLVNFRPDPATGRYDNATSRDPTKGNTYSAYLQLSYKLLDNLELSGGARFTREVKKGSLVNTYRHPFVTNLRPQGVPIFARVANNNVSPEATLTWHPTGETTIYGAYKTGFLSGGISNPGNINNSVNAANLVFRPVKVKGGEVGAKGSFFNRRLTVSSVAFQYDYTDLQVVSLDPTTLNFFTRNAASSRVKGAEVSANLRATSEIALRGALAYNHGRYRDYPNAQCYAAQPVSPVPRFGFCSGGVQSLTGGRVGVAPDWAGNVGATYDTALGTGLRGAITLDAYYKSSYNYTAAATYRQNAVQGAQARLDASARLYQDGGKGLDVGMIVRNLTARRTVLQGSDAPGAAGAVYGIVARPREAVLEATYRF